MEDQLLDDVDELDIVELPPEKVDPVSDEEEFADEKELGFEDSNIVSVPGFVEVSCNTVDLIASTSENSSASQENSKLLLLDFFHIFFLDATQTCNQRPETLMDSE